jgi:DNA-binding GntR family transcriptional regulator
MLAPAKTARQQGVPLYETIYVVLREHIEAGRLPNGLVVGQAGVARAFQASRVPAAAALKRLRDEGLLSDHDGRGYLVGQGDPLRMELEEAGLDLGAVLDDRQQRNRHEWIYPEVEHAVASCLAHGRFLLNESALAEHYKVSRTVAHEVLTRLERTGIVVQESNQRWYAGPLTPDGIRHHFEMRWLLEPEALRQAFPRLRREDLLSRRQHLVAGLEAVVAPVKIERLEHDLHYRTLAHCENPLLLATIRRSQLPLLATHWTFEHFQDPGEISHLVADHLAVFDQLIDGRLDTAAATLEHHLRRSVDHNIELWRRLGGLPDHLRQDYLVAAS